jgi:hypothetical protein
LGFPNLLRVLIGEEVRGRGATEPAEADAVVGTGELVLETNVDDLDPRLWPTVLSALLTAGAAVGDVARVGGQEARAAGRGGLGVAVGVIDPLEMIHVKHHEGKRARVAIGQGERTPERSKPKEDDRACGLTMMP